MSNVVIFHVISHMFLHRCHNIGSLKTIVNIGFTTGTEQMKTFVIIVCKSIAMQYAKYSVVPLYKGSS